MKQSETRKLLDQAFEFGERDTARYVYEEWKEKVLEDKK